MIEERRRQLADSLAETLTELPGAYAQLRHLRSPGSRLAGAGQTSDSPARPPLVVAVLDMEDAREKRDTAPARTDARLDRGKHQWRDGRGKMTSSPAGLRQGVLPTLVSWSRLVDGELWDSGVVHEENGLEPCGRCCVIAPVRARSDRREGPCSYVDRQHWATPTVAAECAFLLDHLGWIADQRWLDEIAADLGQILATIQAIAGDVQVEYHCGKCGWAIEPKGFNEAGKASWYRCTGCSRTFTKASGESALQQEQANFRTLRACAEAVDKPIETLRHWVKQGWVASVGKDRRGKLYDVRRVRNFAANLRRGRPRHARRAA